MFIVASEDINKSGFLETLQGKATVSVPSLAVHSHVF